MRLLPRKHQPRNQRRRLFLHRKRLYARASLAGQLKTALAVQKAIDRMFGDFASEQEDHSAVDEFLEAMRSGKFVKRDE